MINITEQEIIENWKGDSSNPEVSICCTTYNHESYIKDALDGMLMQKSDFPFEIIVHDDASTDETVNIIKEYINRFPNIIKPIFQTENQWSKGNRIMPIVFKYAKGDYIALCEGDDYWTDENKLQIQVDEMKRYPKCDISFHYATKKYEDNSKQDDIFCKHAGQNTFFTTTDVIHFAGPLMPTAAICLRKRFIDYVIESRHPFFKKDLTGFFIQFFASLNGHARYINKNMSVYRSMAKGSWSERTSKEYKYAIQWAQKTINSLETADKLTNFQYTNELSVLKKVYTRKLIYDINIPIKERKIFFNQLKLKINNKERCMWYCLYRYPTIYKMFVLIKRMIKSIISVNIRYKI